MIMGRDTILLCISPKPVPRLTSIAWLPIASEITGGTPGSSYQVAPEGTLEFNPDGTFNAAGSAISTITLIGLTDGASDLTIAAANIDFAGSTQLNAPAAALKQTQTNTNGLQAQLGRIDAALNQTLTFRAEIGARLNSAQTSNDALGHFEGPHPRAARPRSKMPTCCRPTRISRVFRMPFRRRSSRPLKCFSRRSSTS